MIRVRAALLHASNGRSTRDGGEEDGEGMAGLGGGKVYHEGRVKIGMDLYPHMMKGDDRNEWVDGVGDGLILD